jgi:hypothetical protein
MSSRVRPIRRFSCKPARTILPSTYNSRKMVARLQAESSSGHPILIHAQVRGHGIGDSVNLQAEQLATTYTLFENQLR